MTAHAYAPSAAPCPRAQPLGLRPAPATEPPFDDEPQPPARHLRLVGAPEPLPFDRRGPGPRAFEEPLDFFDRQPTSRWELPPPRLWLNRLLRAVLECLEGWRPVGQLRGYAIPAVLTGLAAHANRVPGPGAIPRVHSLHLAEPVDGVVESCAVVRRGGRTHALALRLEGLDGRWLCVALDVIAPRHNPGDPRRPDSPPAAPPPRRRPATACHS